MQLNLSKGALECLIRGYRRKPTKMTHLRVKRVWYCKTIVNRCYDRDCTVQEGTKEEIQNPMFGS
jgi:hypothetical protein